MTKTYSPLPANEQALLDSWEEIYKRGHLTFWVLLALWREPLDYATLSAHIQTLSNATCHVTEQSLYRALRRYDDAGMINAHDGKDKRSKQYALTISGRLVLQHFTARTVKPFYESSTEQLIKEILL